MISDGRALRLRERLGRLLRRDDATDFVVVPRRNGLARRLHLRQEEIVEQAAVLAHAALGKEVVHRHGVHLRPGTTAMAISKFVPADLRKPRSSH